MSEKQIVVKAIEKLYGPCPVGDFVRANAWAEAIDWEEVQETVEADHSDFRWNHPHSQDMTAAEALVFDVRHDMLRHAGHDVKK